MYNPQCDTTVIHPYFVLLKQAFRGQPSNSCHAGLLKTDDPPAFNYPVLWKQVNETMLKKELSFL